MHSFYDYYETDTFKNRKIKTETKSIVLNYNLCLHHFNCRFLESSTDTKHLYSQKAITNAPLNDLL